MKKTKIKFSKPEITDLLKSWLAISIAFTILLNGGFNETLFSLKILFYFAISSVTVGISFLVHELGHKFVAQRYGYWAEFRSFDMMLILAIAMSFFGFVFAAPGAVFISGHMDRKKEGKISLVGPLTNIIFAIIFLIVKLASTGILNEAAGYGMLINAWLAVFNMIPFFNFDGAKVFKWNKTAYFVTLGIAIGLMMATFFI
jgi:Zn-dependent protease